MFSRIFLIHGVIASPARRSTLYFEGAGRKSSCLQPVSLDGSSRRSCYFTGSQRRRDTSPSWSFRGNDARPQDVRDPRHTRTHARTHRRTNRRNPRTGGLDTSDRSERASARARCETGFKWEKLGFRNGGARAEDSRCRVVTGISDPRRRPPPPPPLRRGHTARTYGFLSSFVGFYEVLGERNGCICSSEALGTPERIRFAVKTVYIW